MKKNRRQELQTNILADRLGGVISRCRPYLKITGILLAVGIVVVAGVSWQRANAKSKKKALWQKFIAISVEAEFAKTEDVDALGVSTRLEREIAAFSAVAGDLEALADANKGAAAEGWIRSAAGNALLSVGMRQLYTDQAEARLTFGQAKAIYEGLMAAGENNDSELYDRIRYGYGQSCEGLSVVPYPLEMHSQNLKDAQEMYRELLENASSSGVKRLAEYRLRILAPIAGKTWENGKAQPERADWASWLAQQDLPEEELPPPGGSGFGGGGVPAFNPSALPAGLAPGSATPPAGTEEPLDPVNEPADPTNSEPSAAEPKKEEPKEGEPKSAPKKDDAKPPEPAPAVKK